jgi:hypothetical protein
MSNAEFNFKTVNGDKSYTIKLNEKATLEFTEIGKKVGLKSGMLLSYLIDSYLLRISRSHMRY